MHKLERFEAPACLAKYQHGRDNWQTLNHKDRREIWQKIDTMQYKRCAYCENTLEGNNQEKKAHLEHFRQRDRYPQGTFQWANIFGSCNNDCLTCQVI